MTQSDIERTAEEVLAAHGLTGLPVDPMALARQEGIRLLAGRYGRGFDGRIEYCERPDGGHYYLFCPEEAPPGWPATRVRFSVAHELGHFFLRRHREYLVSGMWRGRRTEFVSERRLEREANYFARAILMPPEPFVAYARRKGGPCTLADLAYLARQVFHTSIPSTAIRYAQLDLRPCAVVVSEAGRVLFSIRSRKMKHAGYARLDRIPGPSLTGRLLLAVARRSTPVTEGFVRADVWFESGPGQLREEARVLGRVTRMITYLVLDENVARN
ncbi:MAG TPA: ImmA/IrrE family metallo-endopeptidase [Gemmataceae bacterium]|jgi:hypothetical protein|nr:ImmA/IrrE family metallo-endopeptidase [Gemmataceae bacterium]